MAASIGWVVFFSLMLLLWPSGTWLFARSALSLRHKIIWSIVLVIVGAAIGLLLPMRGIRDRFLIITALLPLLAFIDIRLAHSNRTFLFWLRACAFEVCTIFCVAALTRYLLTAR